MSTKQNDIIKQYERRWIKPTVFILVLILVPLLIFGVFNGKTIVTAMGDHNANIAETWQLIQRSDKSAYFENTPNVNEHPTATKKEELPNKPVLIAFYLQHCPYCETAHPKIEHNRKLLEEKYPDYDRPVVHVDVKSPLGQELIHEYQVMGASSLLLLTEDPNDHMLVMSATQDHYGAPTPASSNIMDIFKEMDNLIEQELRQQEQRERVK